MSKLTLKWKIFLILNFITIIPVTGFIFFISKNFSHNSGNEKIYTVILLLQLGGIVFNNCFSIYIINHFFPDKILSATTRTLLKLSLVLDTLVLFTTGGVILTEPGGKELNKSMYFFILFLLILFFAITIYFIIMRGQMNRYLSRRNATKKVFDFENKNL